MYDTYSTAAGLERHHVLLRGVQNIVFSAKLRHNNGVFQCNSGRHP